MEQTQAHISRRYISPIQSQRPHNRWDEAVKRLFDIVVAGVCLLLLAPVFAYLAALIQRDSPGPVFYRGARIGCSGKPFRILKFRTMYERPESYAGPRVTANGDERVTRVGRWLRDSKLNELPQLWNVLKGEMSLVGPRPEDPEIVAQWPEALRDEILSVRPGITSPASVMYRDEEDMLGSRPVMETYLQEITPSKLRLDQLYVRYRSLLGDLDVLFWTALVLAPVSGTYKPEEERLFLGPLRILGYWHVSWLLADTLITFAAMAVTGLLWRSMGPLNVGILESMLLAIGFALLFSLANAARGVNRIEWSRAAAADAIEILPSALLATLVALAANYFYWAQIARLLYGSEFHEWVTRPLLPAGMVVVAAAAATFGFVTARYRTRLVTGIATRWVNRRGVAQTAKERVLIVGAGEAGRYAAWMLAQGNYSGAFRVVGFVDDDFYMKARRIYGTEVIGGRKHISEIVANLDVGIILFAIHRISKREQQRLLEICRGTPARLVMFPDIHAALEGLTRPPEQAKPDDQARMPCELCLTKITPLKIEARLAEIEASAEAGNLEQLRGQINEFRRELHSDMETQQTANGED